MLSPVQLFSLSAPSGTPCMRRQALFRNEPNWNFTPDGRFERRRGPFLSFLLCCDLIISTPNCPCRCGQYPGPKRHLYCCLGPFLGLGRKQSLSPGQHSKRQLPMLILLHMFRHVHTQLPAKWLVDACPIDLFSACVVPENGRDAPKRHPLGPTLQSFAAWSTCNFGKTLGLHYCGFVPKELC